jgi:RNA polymerase sigma factor (sigma-70 family)
MLIQQAADLDAPLPARHRAFGLLVARFQDMAFGCAYATLGDAALAEDAAQEAFLAAWQCLPQLREPAAFPGWLKRLVLSRCNRLTRRLSVTTVPLRDEAGRLPLVPGPEAHVEREERARLVRAAIAALPESERMVTVLFYINAYSRNEVAAFLGLSPVSVKKRLASARARLRERLITMIQDDLQDNRPSNDTAFATRVLAFTKMFSALIDEGQSLVRCLNRLAEREDDPAFRAAIEDVNRYIQEGYPLSQGMARHPQYFSEAYVAAIRRGEVEGRLEVYLHQLAAGEGA